MAQHGSRRERLARCSLEGLPGNVRARARQLARLRDALAAALSKEEAAHLVGVHTGANRLVIFTDTSAWCTRLRYRIAQFEAVAENQMGALPHIQFKVQPPIYQQREAPYRPLSESAVQALESAARTIDDEPLAAALRRLATTRDA